MLADEIANAEQLIEEAKKIVDHDERLSFVMNYFLNTVQYDYAYLLIKGYLQETIERVSAFSSDTDLIANPFRKGKFTTIVDNEEKALDDSICITTRIAQGKSEMLEKIDELTYNSNGDVEYFFKQLKDLLSDELLKHLDNPKIVNENVERIIEKLRNDMVNGQIIGEYILCKDVKSIIIDYLLEPNKNMPPVIEDGLLKRGVCQHYANYLAELLPKIGIIAKRVDGTSEFGHSWIAAIVNGELKAIDLTRAIFIRDNFVGIPKEQKSSDWLISTFEDEFMMQSTRTITGVGIDEEENELPLPYTMNGNNFDKNTIIALVQDEEVNAITR